MISFTGGAEQLMLTTVQLISGNSCGTGFFFQCQTETGLSVPFFVTNKHVVDGWENASIKLFLHIKSDNNLIHRAIEVNYKNDWVYHDTHDLACSFANPLFEQVEKELGVHISYRMLGEQHLPTQEQLEQLCGTEEVVMVGYPNGLIDVIKKLPIFRKGITAFHPALEFYSGGTYLPNIGLVDMAVFPGSSGSPICILNQGFFVDHTQQRVNIGSSRFYLLGIAFATAMYFVENETIDLMLPTATQSNISGVHIPINLGYYIHSSEILPLVDKMLAKEHEQRKPYTTPTTVS